MMSRLQALLIKGLIVLPCMLTADYFGGNGGQWAENVHDPLFSAQWSNHRGVADCATYYRDLDRYRYHSCSRCRGPHPYYNPYEYDSPYYNDNGAAGVYFHVSR